MKRLLFLPIALTLLIAACAFQATQPRPLIPRQLLFDNPAKADPQISPNGRYLSYLAPDRNGVLQIWLHSTHRNDDRQLTAEPTRGIRHYTWTYNGQHLLFARETDGDENWHIIAVDMESGQMRDLTPYPGVRSLLIGMSPAKPETVLIAMNLRNRRLFDVYRIELNTGETRMVNRNGGAQSWWSADDQLNVRVAAAFAGTIVRERQGQPWRVARKWHPAEHSRYIGLSADGETFYMSGAYQGEVSALLAVNLATGKETAIASDPTYDVEDALLDPVSRELQAIAFYKEKLEWQVVDRSVAEDFAVLKNLRSGEMSVLHPPYESPVVFSSVLGRRDLSNRWWVVTYERDDQSIEHYL